MVPRVPLPDGAVQSYTGSAVLGPRTDINLRAQLDTYFAANPDSPYKEALAGIGTDLRLHQTMAQSLTGFNQALLMQEQTLQLPVCDPADDLYSDFSNRDVPAAVADANETIPVPGLFFNPIRAGRFALTELLVVDAFGQKFAPTLNVIVAESLRATAAAGAPAILPPRIVQPARLLFRWVSAAPIGGWVLFNHLDTALMIYDAAGHALGSLAMRGDTRDRPFWQGAPGSALADCASLEDALATLGTHEDSRLDRELTQFMLAFGARPQTYLGQLLDALDAAMVTINPGGHAEDAGISLFIGQPFALVRASLRLELQGLPALDQSWSGFEAAVAAGNHDRRPDAGVTAVEYPIRLGDIGAHDDGLLGYFVDDGSVSAYHTFFAATATDASRSGVVRPGSLTLSPVATTDPSPPVRLTMLLDPRGSVHATTGVLPVKEISIPASIYAGALNGIGVTFLTTPLLADHEAPAPALPREPGYAWSWVARSGNTWQTCDARLPGTVPALVPPTRIVEGWLKLRKDNRPS
jgi:hypothetical protein